MIPDAAPCCPECGYTSQPKKLPEGKFQMTDEQAMALAGFNAAQHERQASDRLGASNALLEKWLKKGLMFVIMGVLLPALLGVLYKKLNHSSSAGLDMNDATKLVQMQRSDPQTTEISKDMSLESRHDSR